MEILQTLKKKIWKLEFFHIIYITPIFSLS